MSEPGRQFLTVKAFSWPGVMTSPMIRVRDDAGAATGQFLGRALEDIDHPAVMTQEVRGE